MGDRKERHASQGATNDPSLGEASAGAARGECEGAAGVDAAQVSFVKTQYPNARALLAPTHGGKTHNPLARAGPDGAQGERSRKSGSSCVHTANLNERALDHRTHNNQRRARWAGKPLGVSK